MGMLMEFVIPSFNTLIHNYDVSFENRLKACENILVKRIVLFNLVIFTAHLVFTWYSFLFEFLCVVYFSSVGLFSYSVCLCLCSYMDPCGLIQIICNMYVYVCM